MPSKGSRRQAPSRRLREGAQQPPLTQPQRLGFRHCDPRFPFLWLGSEQPASRWHGPNEGPAHYFASTPLAAWAEFVRHEGITDPEDLRGVRRSLWAVRLPADGYVRPELPDAELRGGLASYAACQQEARRLRQQGAQRLEAPAAAMRDDAVTGWRVAPSGVTAVEVGDPAGVGVDPASVWVLFGEAELIGWPAVEGGSPPARVLAEVRALAP